MTTNPNNWPDPTRPGVPLSLDLRSFPDRVRTAIEATIDHDIDRRSHGLPSFSIQDAMVIALVNALAAAQSSAAEIDAKIAEAVERERDACLSKARQLRDAWDKEDAQGNWAWHAADEIYHAIRARTP